MSAALSAGAERPVFRELRLHPRVRMEVAGRYMLSSGEEFPCSTVDISPGGISLRVVKSGRPGDRVVIYLRELGRIEGRIVRRYPDRLAIEIIASPYRRERIAERIRWLLNNRAGQTEERRATARDDVDASQTILRTENGEEFIAELLELSLLGARIKVGARPPVGARVMLGQKQATVARTTGDCLALSFSMRKRPSPATSGGIDAPASRCEETPQI